MELHRRSQGLDMYTLRVRLPGRYPALLLSSFLVGSIPSLVAHSPTVRQQAPVPIVAPPTRTGQWTGDLDALLERRVVRIAVAYSKTQYYVVKGVQHGVAYESGKAFEGYLNRNHPPKNRHIQVHVVFLPVSRGDLLSDLTEGFADIAVAGLTITAERRELVDFCEPTMTGISEIAVTGPRSPKLASMEDLAGQEVFLRKSSSYWQHVEQLNERLKSEGKPAVKLQAVPDDLEDEDLLEMVNAGLLSTTIVDDYAAKLWSKL